MKTGGRFSLIGLLVAISVIGILAILAVYITRPHIPLARSSQAMSDLKNLQTAVVMYMNRWASMPTKDGENPSLDALLDEDIEYRVVCRIPLDPFSRGYLRAGRGYRTSQYGFLTSMKGVSNSLDVDASYVLYSIGPDAKADITQSKLNTTTANNTGLVNSGDDIFVTNLKATGTQ